MSKAALVLFRFSRRTFVLQSCLALASVAASTSILVASQSHEEPSISFPEGFRAWTHVTSGVIARESPAMGRFGGLHHIYANDAAMEGYRAGRFPDGSVIVFDLFDTVETRGMTQQGSRRQIDVMLKDTGRFEQTGGWGFEEFDAARKASLTGDARTACYRCHEALGGVDLVVGSYRE